ncbi:hypothetical protein OG453_44745 [Streptomyces sp. NBC_01381]|uniref:hypothetical protein n=1 Tax=Streptomyces sp. NBC_01381 TaxID=2903845 RepID=UPI0022576725|nr:hypothetical protein [Streptomyces sp. NBC_01381]MCX4673668.1 hypothetical protein [Streptomyces sp. NBC_01381]
MNALNPGTVRARTLNVGRRLGGGVKAWARPRRAFALGAGLLLLATLLSLLLAGSAGAAPEPPPAPSPSQYEPGLEPEVPGLLPPEERRDEPKVPYAPNGDEDAQEQKDKEDKEEERARKRAAWLADWNKRIAQYKNDRRNGGVLSAFEVTDQYGNPVSAYRIYSDTGSWKDWDLKIEAFLVEMLFLATKWLVSFACFLIAWSLSFKLAGLLLKPALIVSDALYANVVVQIGLPGVCLTYAGTIAGWHLMFGQRARGWGEAAAALVISALAVTTLAAPPQMLLSEQDGAVATTRALAIEVAALVLDNQDLNTDKPTTLTNSGKDGGGWESAESNQLSRPITDALADAFVVRPAMLLSYGQTFEGKCAKEFQESRIEQAVADQYMDELLDSGENMMKEKIPWVGDTLGGLMGSFTEVPDRVIKEKAKSKGPVVKFEKACVKGGATSLKKASMDKVGGAFFMLLAAFLTCLFITVVDSSFLYAQFCIAKEAMIAKVALVIGVLPGPGRSWLWSRATSTMRSLALMVAAVLALAVLIVVITAIINAPEKDLPGGVTVRFIVIDFVCISAFVYRKRLARATESAALRARSRLNSSVFGGSEPSELGQQAPRRGIGRKLLVGGMMLGAMAASGGAAGAAYGHARGSTALVGRLARGTGRVIGGTAKAAVGTTKAAAKGGIAVTKFGLKSTIGLPVYGPRAARRTTAAVAAVPGQVTGGVQQLGQRLAQVHQQYAPPVANFGKEYGHNLRSLGRIATGRRPLGRYTPPQRPAAAAARAGRRPAAPVRPAGPARRPSPAAASPAPRRRPLPPRVPQPPASQQQAALQRRLARVQLRMPPTGNNNGNNGNNPPPPAPRIPVRPAPRRRSGGRP